MAVGGTTGSNEGVRGFGSSRHRKTPMRRSRVVYWHLVSGQVYGPRWRGVSPRGVAGALSSCSVGPEEGLPLAGGFSEWRFGQRRRGNAAGVLRGTAVDLGRRSGCQRRGSGLSSAGCGSSARTTTSLSRDTRYGVARSWEQRGFGGAGKRISPLAGFGWWERGTGGPGSIGRLGVQREGSAKLAHGRCGHRDVLGIEACFGSVAVESRERRRCRLVGAYLGRRVLRHAAVRMRTELHEGNGRGDAVRLLARGVLRRV